MISQIHMAKSASKVFQDVVRNISGNLANVSTVGYKTRSTNMENLFPMVFERVIEEYEQPGEDSTTRRTINEYGQGVRMAEVVKDMSQGTIEITEQELDFAIEGHGYFQVKMPSNEIVYTRAGNFHRDNEGTILTSGGLPLEPRIRIPREASEIVLDSRGRLLAKVDSDREPREIGRIELAVFQNPAELRDIGSNLFKSTALSGDPRVEEPEREMAGRVRQGALEFSNVNIIDELVKMMAAQKAFELAIKSIKASDAILKAGGDLS